MDGLREREVAYLRRQGVHQGAAPRDGVGGLVPGAFGGRVQKVLAAGEVLADLVVQLACDVATLRLLDIL